MGCVLFPAPTTVGIHPQAHGLLAVSSGVYSIDKDTPLRGEEVAGGGDNHPKDLHRQDGRHRKQREGQGQQGKKCRARQCRAVTVLRQGAEQKGKVKESMTGAKARPKAVQGARQDGPDSGAVSHASLSHHENVDSLPASTHSHTRQVCW